MKKKLVGIIISMLLFATFTSVAVPITNETSDIGDVSRSDDWPMYRHDVYHTGNSSSTGPETDDILYLNEISPNLGISEPIGADGIIYAQSGDSHLYAFDASTGEQIWISSLLDGHAGSPSLVDDKIYTKSGTGHIYCLDASNGHTLDNYNILSQSSSINAVNGFVYLTAYNEFYCFDATDLDNIIWQYNHTLIGGKSTPAYFDGFVFFGTSYNMVHCFDAETGVEQWNYTTGGAVDFMPVISDNKLYIGSWDSKVYCFDPDPSDGVDEGIVDPPGSTYDLIWEYDTGESLRFGGLAVGNGNVFVPLLGAHVILCLDALDGTLLWTSSTLGTGLIYSPSIAGNKLYVTSQFYIYCLNAENGSIIWDDALYNIYGSPSTPAVVDGRVYIGTSKGYLICYYPNDAPEAPEVDGPEEGLWNEEITFTVETSDPDGDDVWYIVDWDDGEDPEEDGPFTSGTPQEINHIFTEEKEYNIAFKARDQYMAEGNTTYHLIQIIKHKLNIDNIKGGITSVVADITNDGDRDADNVEWNIHAYGGILNMINVTTEGTIDTLEAGQTMTVKTDKPIFGFGNLNVKVTVYAAGAETNPETKSGFVLLFFVII